MTTTELPQELVGDTFRRLREFNNELIRTKANKDERVDALINACISEGFNHGKRITGAIKALGYNRRHAGMRLNAGTRSEPEWPYWGKSDDGTYYATKPSPASES
jgi:hypothetical protein